MFGFVAADLHHADRFASAFLQAGDHLLDFGCGLLGTRGQRSDLVGHHRKAAPLFAGASGLDGRVERQQIGLLCDALNHRQHRADAVAFLFQPLDNLGSALHFFCQRLNGIDGAGGQLAALLGFLFGLM